MTKLVLPDNRYKVSYIEATREFQQENNQQASNYLALDVNDLKQHFESYVSKLLNQRLGLDLPEGYVPASEYWIIDETDNYLGRLHIRHGLTDYLLKIGGHIGYNIRPSQRGQGHATSALGIGLKRAKALGLDQVLITCDDDNLASARIIEKKSWCIREHH